MRKRILSVCLALLCAVMALVLPVTAATSAFPSGGTKQLTLRLNSAATGEELALSGVEYSLYKVGTFSFADGGSYTYTPATDFKGTEATLRDLDFWKNNSNTLIAKAETLAKYVESHEVTTNIPAARTNNDGVVTFTGLDNGLYLALGKSLTKAVDGTEYVWVPQATLVSVPFQYANGEWISSVRINVKVDPTQPPKEDDPPKVDPDPTTIDVSVHKEWEGDDHPDAVIVKLMKNGAQDDLVSLNDSNNWSYTWYDLEDSYTWTVEENVPDGWEADIIPDGNNFTIINRPQKVTPPPTPTPTPTPTPGGGRRPGGTVTPSLTPTATPGPSSDPVPTPPSAIPETSPTPTNDPEDTPPPATPVPSANPVPSDDPVDPSDPPVLVEDTPTDPGEPGLPQTGQLWWPVPLLLALGVPLLLIGAVLFIRKERSEGSHD